MRMLPTVLAFLALPLFAATPALGLYQSGFEDLVGSPAGVILTGQDSYYLPAGSTDFMVYTYAGNAVGLPTNPEGGLQFIGGTGPGNAIYARAQRDLGFAMDRYTISHDFAGTFLGTGASGNNVGSFSIRSSDTAVHYIHLMSFVDPNVPELGYNAWYLAYDQFGTQFAQPGLSPGPAWDGLALDHWYHAWTTFDLNSNLILEVGIRDIETGVESVVAPADWYLEGGAGGSTGPPTSFRFFGGGAVAGNVLAFDNIDIQSGQQMGACCFEDYTCEVLSEEDCTRLGGVEWLVGEDCEPNPCLPVSIEETSWGKIKSQFK